VKKHADGCCKSERYGTCTCGADAIEPPLTVGLVLAAMQIFIDAQEELLLRINRTGIEGQSEVVTHTVREYLSGGIAELRAGRESIGARAAQARRGES